LNTGRYLKALLGFAGLAAAIAVAPGVAGAEETVKFTVNNGESIDAPLAGTKPGDPENGRKVAIHRKKGNCLACHVMPIPEQQFHGELGPDLNGVGSRYSAGEIRLRVVNPKYANPDTIMPAFYKADGLHRVLKGFEGKTMLSAQEVEDIVAYLVTLKE
jgi:sulfur-oxidizing protein SoxX